MPENNTTSKTKKAITGTVISDKMNKTRVVKLDMVTRHSMYAKAIRRSRNVKVHDEQNAAKTGDTVKIVTSGPYSKDKRWKLVEVIKSGG